MLVSVGIFGNPRTHLKNFVVVCRRQFRNFQASQPFPQRQSVNAFEPTTPDGTKRVPDNNFFLLKLRANCSMFKMSLTRQNHRRPALINQSDRLLILQRSPRMNDRRDPGIQQQFRSIRKRKKRIAGRNSPRRARSGLGDRQPRSARPIHLSRAAPNSI